MLTTLLFTMSLWTADVSSADGSPEPQSPPAAPCAGTEELARYVAEALANHPGIRALHAEWLAALERIPQAAALDDPMFTYGQFVQSEMNRFRVMLSQRFPWFGTRRLRAGKAAAEADSLLSRLSDERNRVTAEVKRAFHEYAFLAQRIELTRSQAEVLEYMEDTVRSKLSLGLAGDDELLRVSMAKAELEDVYRQLLNMRPSLSGRLLAAIGRSAGEELPWPVACTSDSAPPLPQPPPTPVALARARVANPSLHVYESLAEGRRKDTALAKKAAFPEITLGLEYMSVSKPRQILPDRVGSGTLMALEGLGSTLLGMEPLNLTRTSINMYELTTTFEPMNYSDGGEDDVVLSVSVNLPIWREKIRAGVAEARLMEEAVDHERRKTAIDLDATVQETMFEFRDAQRRRALYLDTLLPQASQTYESLQGRYSLGYGTVGFIDVMESIQRILEYELARLQAERDWRVAAARLEYLMGGPWSERDAVGTEVPAGMSAEPSRQVTETSDEAVRTYPLPAPPEERAP